MFDNCKIVEIDGEAAAKYAGKVKVTVDLPAGDGETKPEVFDTFFLVGFRETTRDTGEGVEEGYCPVCVTTVNSVTLLFMASMIASEMSVRAIKHASQTDKAMAMDLSLRALREEGEG